jgi:RNA polymerase sigma factor (sigma-70 family)
MTQERWDAAWRERDRLVRMARSRVDSLQDAEDIASEAIRRAGCQEGLPADAVPRWLTTVTLNLCRDWQRRRMTERALLRRAELWPGSVPGPEEALADAAEARWLLGAVHDLPGRQAEALTLRAEGYDNPAIANHLGTTLSTVEGLLKRSRATLRALARAAGAALVGLRLSSWPTRRSVSAVLAALLVVVAMQPGSGARSPEHFGPKLGEGPGLGSAPSLVAAGRASKLPTESPQPRRSAPKQRPLPADPNIAKILPYDGPHCLTLYCLPIADAAADKTLGSETPKGWSPANIHDYFGEPAWSARAASRHPLVVVVSVGQFTWTEPDLKVYRSTFGLPSCNQGNGCLRLIDRPDIGSPSLSTDRTAVSDGVLDPVEPRTAGSAYGNNPGVEQSQIVQGVSAVCPECRLAVVRAASRTVANVRDAVRAAVALHGELLVVNVSDSDINQSFEDPALYAYTLVLADGGILGYTGNGGYGAGKYPEVVAVGGTQVVHGRVDAVEDTETFCNTQIPQPAWQRSAGTGCAGRAGVDLAAPGEIYQGLSVYVSGGTRIVRGWYHPGNNYQAVAITAGLFARHHLAAVVHGPGDLYAHPEWFADVVHGNSACAIDRCQTSALVDAAGCLPHALQICYSRPGWDGPTGLGEPRHLPWL